MGTDLYAKCFYRTSRETLSPFKHFKLKTTDSETVHNKKSSSYHVTLLSRPSTGTSSAKLSELPDMHGLTDSQLSELQGAVRALDDFLLFCVDDLRNNRWIHPNTKHVADCLVRGLVVSFF
jgi:hypothetical protein